MSNGLDLRLGDWHTALADVGEVDAVITDPPYSERTHAGHRAGVVAAGGGGGGWARSNGRADPLRPRRDIAYTSMDPEGCRAFVEAWVLRNRGWFVVFSDHTLSPAWLAAFDSCGLTSFQPVPVVVPGMTVRLAGDGPSSWATYLNVARPKKLSKWGTLPGAYIGRQGERYIPGSKSTDVMRAIVRDYSRPSDLVVDPHAGSGTTLRACAIEGRRCVGAEIDPKTYKIAADRLRGWGPEEQNGMRNLFAVSK